MTPVDYARTVLARENRERKAAALAAAARRLGVGTPGITIGGGHRRDVWRGAGLDRSPSEDTWHLVHQLLTASPPADPALVRVPGPARASSCNAPTCDADSTHLYASGWWCDTHSPWGRRGLTRSDANRVPGAPCELERLRAARGITSTSHKTPALTVVDERAIASSKRRSTTAAFQTVRAAQAHHRNRRSTA